MKENKNIETFDSKGKHHGYQEWYANGDKLWHRGYRKRDNKIGYNEWHNKNFKAIRYFIK